MNNITIALNILKKEKADALIVTNSINIFYLSGFSGVSPQEREAILIVNKVKPAILITARLYETEARKLKSTNLNVKIATERDQYEKFIENALKGSIRIGFESFDLKFAEYKKFKKYLAKGAKFIPTKNLIENIRQIKSNQEIQNIKTAQLRTQAVFNNLIKTIKVGQTEQGIKDMLEKIAKSKSQEPLAFDPIVASGPNSALPHHKISNRKIKKGDALLFDFGVKHKSYCADFSRTVFIGKSSDIQRNIFTLVLNAQQTTIGNIKPNTKAKKTFEITHNIFKKSHVDSHFIHSLGHGIGLAVHEKPSLGAKSKDTLEPGMVFSVEPGLYFPWGGVRIEDLVVMGSKYPKQLGEKSSYIEICK